MSWWHYLLLVNFYLVIFFGFYVLLLRRETFFQLNRIYLVAASLLSFFIPLIQADWVKNLFITKQVALTLYNSPTINAYSFAPVPSTMLTMGELLNYIYVAVTLFLVTRLIWQLVVLKKAIEKPSPSAAYSFFKKISLGENVAKSAIINQHEQVHAGQWHSVDVMIIETVMIINWFNPVVYLYRFAIKYIHEFIADKEVIQAGTNKADYALLLLSQTFDVPAHRLVNPFYNHSLLKKRIMMLQKNKSQRIALAKYGLSAPLFILMLVLSSATINNSKAVRSINRKTEKLFLTPISDTVHSKNIVFTQVENQPEFPGGLSAFGHFLASNIHYPLVDKNNNVEGKVLLQFIVEKDGSITNIKAIRGPSETLKDEALRAMKLSPNWKPGYQNNKPVRVSYVVPVNFSLNNDKPMAPPFTASTAKTNDGDKTFSIVETEPEFPGGLTAFGEFLGKNIHYPAEMRQKNVQGKVFLKFIVEKDGSLSNIQVVKGLGYGSSEEAIRVMGLSPRWTPGYQNRKPVRVSFTVPINFALTNDKPPVHGAIIDTGKNKNVYNLQLRRNNPPLIVIDGVINDWISLDAIDQNTIASVTILKNAAAAAIYGDRAKNGVILVATKTNKTSAKPVKITN